MAVKQRLQDKFIQNQHADSNNSPKGVTYNIFKSNYWVLKVFRCFTPEIQKNSCKISYFKLPSTR